jgi:hypothetical protein
LQRDQKAPVLWADEGGFRARLKDGKGLQGTHSLDLFCCIRRAVSVPGLVGASEQVRCVAGRSSGVEVVWIEVSTESPVLERGAFAIKRGSFFAGDANLLM